MSFDSIVRGADWNAEITVNPGPGDTNADIEAFLTGATVSLDVWYQGSNVASGTGSVISPSERTITVGLTDVVTAALANLGTHNLDVRVTDSGGTLTYPVQLVSGSAVSVRDFAP